MPEFSKNLSAKLYNTLGIEIVDITNKIIYDAGNATGIIDLQVNGISRGLYYLHLSIGTEKRTIPIVVM